jgi:cell division protein FtsQ
VRSVKIDRKNTQPRAKSPRGSGQRVTRASSAAKPFGKRKQPNRVQRAWRAVTGWLLFRKPILIASGALIALVFIAALFISGTVHRTVNAVNAAIDGTITDAGFGIAQVHIVGNQRTPGESIAAALGFRPGESIFGADLQSARARLKQMPWVADADVRRRYPDDISVRIAEKLPYALWQGPDGKLWVVERDGGLITTDGIEQFKGLPLLAGAGGSSAADIVDAVAQHRAISARVRAYSRVSERRWDLILEDGVIVNLPETGWAKELDTLETLIIDRGVLERNVAVIDMRSPTHYFLTLKNGEKKTETKGNAA